MILSAVILIFVCLLIVLQKEWLCLNCQTQRALSGQLGDLRPPPSPSKMPAKSQPTPPSSPAIAVSSTPSPPAPTVTASPTKALIRTPSVTQAPADKSEHDSVTADAKCVVESAAVKQDEELAVVESTQVVPEPNKDQTLDTAFENTTVKSTPPEKTIRAAVMPVDIIPRDIADAKETDAKQCGIVEQTEPKAQNKKGRESEPEQHEPIQNDLPSDHANIAEKLESTDKYPSEATILDNKAEIRLDRLQVTEAKLKIINEAKNGTTVTVNSDNACQAWDHGTEVVSLSETPTKKCSPELASLANMQTSSETIPDNNNGSKVDLVASPIMVTEKEKVVNMGHDSTNILERSFTPEKPIHPVQVVGGKDEVKNEIFPNSGSDAKHPFAYTSEHADNTKGEFVENEYEVGIKTGNMSPSENLFVYSVSAEVENNKIEGINFDQWEEKQSGKKSKVEEQSVEQGKAHNGTQETQASPAETPECVNPAFPPPNELIKSELNLIILEQISHNTCLKTVGVTSCTSSVSPGTDKNIHERTEGAHVGATESEAKGAEDLQQTQAVECLIPKVAVEFTACKENKETLEEELEHVRREKTKYENQASLTGREELETFLAGNKLSVTDDNKTEKVLQNEPVEDTIEPESSTKNYEHIPKPTVFKLEKITLDVYTNENTISQVDEVCLASQMTVPNRDAMSSENTQPVVEPSKEMAPRAESVDDKKHSEKVEKTDKLEHNDTRSEISSSSLTEAEKVLNVSKEKTVTSNSDSVKTENECVIKKDDSLSAVGDQEFTESRENPVPQDKKIKQTLDTASGNPPEQSTIRVVLADQRTQEPPIPAVDVNDDIQLKRKIKSKEQQSVPLAQKVDAFSSVLDKENKIVNGEQKENPGSKPTKEIPNSQSNSHKVFCTLNTLDPVVKPNPPCPVASKQDKDKSYGIIQSPGSQEKNQDGTKPLIKPKYIEKLGQVTAEQGSVEKNVR